MVWSVVVFSLTGDDLFDCWGYFSESDLDRFTNYSLVSCFFSSVITYADFSKNAAKCTRLFEVIRDSRGE